MDEDSLKSYKDLLDTAKDIKESLNLESIDTALLMMISLDVDQLRFHNTS